jgi:hypothetical protein
MNSTFNIKRFGLLLKKQWFEFGKIYLITLAVVAGIILSFYSFALYSFSPYDSIERQFNFREPLFIILGILFITIISSNYYAHLGQKSKAIIDLMLPASVFEKFLTGVLFSSFISIVSYVVVFKVIDLTFLNLTFSSYEVTRTVTSEEGVSTITSYNEQLFSRYLMDIDSELLALFILIPFLLTSIFLLGSIYFNRFHYIKTTISTMTFVALASFVVFKTTEFLNSGKMPRNTSGNHENDYLCLIPLSIALLTLIIWGITYVRLKEKEV